VSAGPALPRRRLWALGLLTAGLGLAACSSTPPVDENVHRPDRRELQGRRRLSGRCSVDRRQPLLVATFVNLEVLTESSRLGRLFSEQVGGRLAQRGYAVKELKLRETCS
jgi:hypothetical protein